MGAKGFWTTAFGDGSVAKSGGGLTPNGEKGYYSTIKNFRA